MFSFFRSKPPAPANFAFLGTDMQSHILPGIDDGAPDVATAVELVRGLAALGYKRLIATPHIYKELHPNTRETIENAWQQCTTALADEGVELAVQYAAEHMMDDHFEQLLTAKTLLPISQNYVLVETLAIAPPPQMDTWIFQMQTKGYCPVIAHPERYAYWHQNKNKLHDLHERGCKLQINLLSLTGAYSAPVRDQALYLLKHRLAAFAGTDLHHHKHLAMLQKMCTDSKLMRKLEGYEWENCQLLN